MIARLESLRLAALADRVDADAALGRHAALVPELTDLVRRHPFDERFAGQLMLALYRDGRQADALATYARAAHRLGEELGVDPGPALRDLQRRVLAQDPGLLVEPAPVPAPVLVSEAAPEPALHAPAANAPPPGEPLTAPLVGRIRELAQAEAILADPAVRLVTLLGPGGAGKTRLARELLRRVVAGTAGHPLRRAEFVPLAARNLSRRRAARDLPGTAPAGRLDRRAAPRSRRPDARRPGRAPGAGQPRAAGRAGRHPSAARSVARG